MLSNAYTQSRFSWRRQVENNAQTPDLDWSVLKIQVVERAEKEDSLGHGGLKLVINLIQAHSRGNWEPTQYEGCQGGNCCREKMISLAVCGNIQWEEPSEGTGKAVSCQPVFWGQCQGGNCSVTLHLLVCSVRVLGPQFSGTQPLFFV